jgi:hypothetical protein
MEGGQPEFVEHGDHSVFDCGEPLAGGLPIRERERDPFQRAAAMVDDAGGVGQRGEQAADDTQAGFLPAAAGDLAAHSGLEAGRPQPPGPVQVAAVAVAYDAQGCDPGLGPEGLLGGIQRGGPGRAPILPSMKQAADERTLILAAPSPPAADANRSSTRPPAYSYQVSAPSGCWPRRRTLRAPGYRRTN